MAHAQYTLTSIVLASLLASASCSVDAREHRAYGLTCAQGQMSYRGYCIPATTDGGPDSSAAPSRDDSGARPDQAGSRAEGGATSPAPLADAGGDPVRDPPASGTAGTSGASGSAGMTSECAEQPCYEAAHGCSALPDGGYACVGTCKAGVQRCEHGERAACEEQVAPATEHCSEGGAAAADEDCDGAVDEGCECNGQTQSCYSGPAGTSGRGPCRSGTQRCSEGAFGACEGEVLPRDESCANPGVDDDCDGSPDDVANLGASCTAAAAQGACTQGQLRCANGALACEAGAPSSEVCGGGDEDCDGRTDEGFDLASDERNCGSCDRACGAGETCCAGDCVDTRGSTSHCGTCGNRCGAGLGCCDGNCYNLASDQNNCGNCGNACGLLEGCCRTACRLLSLGC